MKLFAQPLILKYLAFWDAARAIWMSYLVLLDFRSLAFSQNTGPYVGIGIDRNLIFTVGAMPTKLFCILAGFQFGRLGETLAEVTSVLVYSFVALAIWRRRKEARALAVLLTGAESLILAMCIRYALWTTLLPEFRQFSVSCGFVFFVMYSVSTTSLLGPYVKRLFGKRPAPAVGE